MPKRAAWMLPVIAVIATASTLILGAGSARAACLAEGPTYTTAPTLSTTGNGPAIKALTVTEGTWVPVTGSCDTRVGSVTYDFYRNGTTWEGSTGSGSFSGSSNGTGTYTTTAADLNQPVTVVVTACGNQTDCSTWTSGAYVPTVDTTIAAVPASSLPDSTYSTAPVLATGSVTGASSGMVVAYALPDEQTVANDFDSGIPVPLRPVARASLGSSGSYTLRVSSLASLGIDGSADGFVNYIVVSSVPAQAAQMSAFMRPVDSADALSGPASAVNPALSPPPADEATPSPADTIDPSYTGLDTTTNDPAVLDPTAPETVVTSTGTAMASSPYSANSNPYPGCYGWPKKKLGLHWAKIGETFAGTGLAQFTYQKGATSQFGFGVSVTGDAGSWSLGGAMGNSSTLSANFGQFKAVSHVSYFKQVRYAQFAYDCPNYSNGFPYFIGYAVQPLRTTGGFDFEYGAAVPKATHCAPEPGPSNTGKPFVWGRSASDLNTFSAGVSTTGIIGINLSAQTGASKTASLAYSFTSAGHSMCGNNGPPESAKRVQSIP